MHEKQGGEDIDKKGDYMKLTLIEKRKETEDVFSFIFEPSKSVTWQAGQYLIYKIPHEKQDDRGDSRIFTISSPPYQKQIMLTTKYYFQESSSFKKALFSKKIGDKIESSNVKGNFILEDNDKKMVFIAGGIGITPFRSMLLEMDYRKNIQDIVLIYSNKNDKSIIFKDILDSLAKKYAELSVNYIFSPQRCDVQLIHKIVADAKSRVYYISGPIIMINSVEETLQYFQVKKENIKKDYFPRVENSSKGLS